MFDAPQLQWLGGVTRNSLYPQNNPHTLSWHPLEIEIDEGTVPSKPCE